jgi:type I site-specific restriction-modification system R (restriction) subunit
MSIFWIEARNSTGRGDYYLVVLSERHFINSDAFGSKLVTLPYNLLLQKSAREALGIDLKNQIVLIDEAHSTF